MTNEDLLNKLFIRIIKESGNYLNFREYIRHFQRFNATPSTFLANRCHINITTLIKHLLIPTFFLKYYNKTISVRSFSLRSHKEILVDFKIKGFDTYKQLFIVGNGNNIAANRIKLIEGKPFDIQEYTVELTKWQINGYRLTLKPDADLTTFIF